MFLVSGKENDLVFSGACLRFLHSNSSCLTGVKRVNYPQTNNSIVVFIEVERNGFVDYKTTINTSIRL